MAKNHKTKIPKRQLKSIIKIEDGNESKLDAAQQRAPRRALDFLKHLERKKEEKNELNGNEKNCELNGKGREKNGSRVELSSSKSITAGATGATGALGRKGKRNDQVDGSASSFKVGKELTNKRVKKKEFHKKKLEKKQAKKTFGLDEQMENLLREKNQIRFGERVEDVPKFTVFPKKVIKKEFNQDPHPQVEKNEKKENPSNPVRNRDLVQENKIGRARKLKTLPEAERKALLQERSRIIALYRNSKINNKQIN